MKSVLLQLILLIGAVSGLHAQQPAYAQSFVYDKKIHDFGTIKEKDGLVKHTFTFTNRSKSPVVINDVSAWCGCTSADFTKTPVRPGSRATVTVTFNPFKRPGRFSKEVMVYLNGGTEYTRIWVKGNVVPYVHPVTEDHPYAYGQGLYMSHRVLPFSDLRKGERRRFLLRVANDTDKPMQVEFRRQPDNTVLKMVRSLRLEPKERTVISVSYTAWKTYRHNRHIMIQPVVNGHRVKPLRVTWLGSSPE